jgi:hypothetical protein
MAVCPLSLRHDACSVLHFWTVVADSSNEQSGTADKRLSSRSGLGGGLTSLSINIQLITKYCTRPWTLTGSCGRRNEPRKREAMPRLPQPLQTSRK